MNEKVKAIVDMAIREEEYFHELYARAAELAESESAKQLLLRLSKEEQAHKERLASLGTGDLVLEQDIAVGEELALTPIDEFNSLKEIFEFAIRSEISAMERYSQLSLAVDDEQAKELFLWLVEQEQGHHDLLLNELRKMSI